MIIDKLLDMGTVTTTSTSEVKSDVLDFGNLKKNFLGSSITTDEINNVYFVAQLTAITAVAGTITLKFYSDATDGLTTVVFQLPAITIASGMLNTYLFNGTIPVKLSRYCSFSVTCSDATADVSVKGHLGHIGTKS